MAGVDPKNVTEKGGKRLIKIDEQEVRSLCAITKKSFLEQSPLLEIKGPVNVCGDIHGQYFDLLKLFSRGGKPPKTRYLFLGDYVDRGKNSLEVICLLFCLKVVHPQSVYLIRGNHEVKNTNMKYGFRKEVKRRFRKQHKYIYNLLNRTFDFMPLAGVVNRKVFCCHGGIGPDLTKLQQIRDLQRPLSAPKGWVKDVLWSDPDEEITGWEKMNRPDTIQKHRGTGYLFGKHACSGFLRENELKFICRAHECEPRGFRWFFGKKLVTVFSAPNYKDDNNGAIFRITKSGNPGVVKQFN